MSLKRNSISMFLPLLLLATGCKVGPNYRRPAVQAPAAYSENGRNGSWPDAAPADAEDRGDWWRVYQDPVLDDLERRCLAANQQIAGALHAYEQAHDLVRVSKSALYPSVSIGGGATRNQVSSTRPLIANTAATTYWDFLIPVNVSWEPDFWGNIRRQVESSAASAQASAGELANVRLGLQGEVALTYLQVRGIDLQAKLLRDTVTTYSDMLKLTQMRLNKGLSSEIDVQQATAQLEQVKADLIGLGVQRAQDEHALAVLVGVPATGFHLEENAIAGEPPAVPTGVPSQLLERRPDVAALERKVAAANAMIGVAKGAYFPQIVLGGGGGVESRFIDEVFQASSSTWYAGPTASEVLFDAGKRKAQVEYAVAQREQAVAAYREQVLSAFRDVEDQLSSLRILQAQVAEEHQAVEAARRSTALAVTRYKRGIASYLEVLTNQSTQLNDERLEASLETQRIVASAQLQVALGGGWKAAMLPRN